MLKYLGKRLLSLLPMLLIISVVAFFLVRVVPTDPAEAYLSSHQMPLTEENIAFARADMGLDKPLLTQYGLWLWNAVRLDFGTSYSSRTDVLDDFIYCFWNTMELTVGALFWIVLAALGSALLAVRKPGGIADTTVRVGSMLGSAIPAFVLGYVLVIIFSLKLGLTPVSGRGSLRHLLLPSITLAAAYIAMYAQMLRNNMLAASATRPVTYARARGIPEGKIQRGHILRHAMLPVASSFGVSFGRLIAGSVLVENVFSWPGLGRLITSAVLSRDYPVVQGYIVLMALIFIICNLLSDMACAALDPRVRLNEVQADA